MITAPPRGPAHAARAHGPARHASASPPRAPRTTGIRDVVISVLGVIGTLSVAWLVMSWLLGLSFIVFVTGSMAPTMPTGAAALVQTVPAEDLRVGDVVTVTRPGTDTPVTHRVVAVDVVPADADARSLTLQGDANRIVDSDRYVVDEARRVIAAAPYLGAVVIWMKSPTVMVVLSVFIAAAIAWALWPTRPSGQSDSSAGR